MSMVSPELALVMEGAPPPMSNADLDQKLAVIIDRAGLTASTSWFFRAAKAVKTVDGHHALRIARYWREITKTFMFTNISGLGAMSQEAASCSAPPHHFLSVIQTAFRIIGDDLNNVMPVFQRVAPAGVGGIHYVWWENSILRPLEARFVREGSKEAVSLPAGVQALLQNMHRLAASAVGTAVQLRVVEAIALNIAVAFRRVFARVVVDGVRLFPTADKLAWMDAHIKAEVAHQEQVSDHETGMASIADTNQKQAEMLRLTAEYAGSWEGALDSFASLL